MLYEQKDKLRVILEKVLWKMKKKIQKCTLKFFGRIIGNDFTLMKFIQFPRTDDFTRRTFIFKPSQSHPSNKYHHSSNIVFSFLKRKDSCLKTTSSSFSSSWFHYFFFFFLLFLVPFYMNPILPANAKLKDKKIAITI